MEAVHEPQGRLQPAIGPAQEVRDAMRCGGMRCDAMRWESIINGTEMRNGRSPIHLPGALLKRRHHLSRQFMEDPRSQSSIEGGCECVIELKNDLCILRIGCGHECPCSGEMFEKRMRESCGL